MRPSDFHPLHFLRPFTFQTITMSADTLDLALQYHRAGDFERASQIYRQIIAADPNAVDALHLLGAIALQTGKYEIAYE